MFVQGWRRLMVNGQQIIGYYNPFHNIKTVSHATYIVCVHVVHEKRDL